MIKNLISTLRNRLETRRKYNQALAEISALDSRDLADMNTTRDQLHLAIRREIYG